MGFSVAVELEHPIGAVFDYLADPANRPQWQSSLRTVELLTDGPPGVGTRWYDVTWPGVRPLMEVTVHETNVRWAEVGRWRGIEVLVDMVFAPVTESRTRVRITTTTHAPGRLRPLGLLLDRLGPLVGRNDLRRAGRRMG